MVLPDVAEKCRLINADYAAHCVRVGVRAYGADETVDGGEGAGAVGRMVVVVIARDFWERKLWVVRVASSVLTGWEPGAALRAERLKGNGAVAESEGWMEVFGGEDERVVEVVTT